MFSLLERSDQVKFKVLQLIGRFLRFGWWCDRTAAIDHDLPRIFVA